MAKKTNVELLSWGEFQSVFEDQWYTTHLSKYSAENLEPMADYLGPLPAMVHWDLYLGDRDTNRLKELYRQYHPLGIAVFRLLPRFGVFRESLGKLTLPLSEETTEYSCLPDNVRRQRGYREFIQALEEHIAPIRGEFQKYRDLAYSRRERAVKPVNRNEANTPEHENDDSQRT